MDNRVRAAFTIENHGGFVVIVDQAAFKKTMSVTNDAENVIRYLHDEGLLRRERVLYRDSYGCWDELKHDGHGRFTGFGIISARSLDEAMQKVETHAV